MEPLSAFSAAAGVVQLVDFTSRLISESYQIYKSSDGELSRNGDLDTVTKDLLKLNKLLTLSMKSSRKDNNFEEPSEASLQSLLRDCSSVAEELHVALSKLKLQPEAKRQRWGSVQRGLRSIWSQDDINSLDRRLDNFRQQISMHLLVSLRYVDVVLLPLAVLTLFCREQMNDLKKNEVDLDGHEKDKKQDSTAGIGQEYLKYIDENNLWQASVIDAIHRNSVEDNHQYHHRKLSQLVENLDPILASNITQSLLMTLRFPGMVDRQQHIPEAHKRTFDWLYEDQEETPRPWSDFTEWLKGNGQLYWITGKAGAGKSTLMKYIQSHDKTQQALRYWTGEETLVQAGFFFWNSGTNIQMSQEGLLRTLLYDCLTQCPDLVPQVLPQRWEAFRLFGQDPQPWSWLELMGSLNRLLTPTPTLEPRKFFFFIDGLDEFNGDHKDLIDLIHRLVSLPNVKICVASRPWIVFEDAFNRAPSLMLHNLTKPDIIRYVSDHLSQSPGFQILKQIEPGYASELVENITSKASGVFFWVYLVVRSLVSGLSSGDRISDLQKKLDNLPSDLEALFWKIIHQLDHEQFERACQIFQIIGAVESPPSVLRVAFADEDDDVVFNYPIKLLSEVERKARVEMMRRRINYLCRGLLEVTPNADAELATAKVEYLHRTVKDFLNKPEVGKKIGAGTKPPFNPHRSWCKSSIMALKTINPDHLLPSVFWHATLSCLYKAVQAEDSSGESQSQLFDEIDRAASQLTAVPNSTGLSFVDSNSPGTIAPHWTATRFDCYSSTSFLNFAVQCQLLSYVKVKLANGLPTTRPSDKPLLYSAVCAYSVFRDQEHPHFSYSTPNAELVELLLELGADPNESVLGETIWERVLQDATRTGHGFDYCPEEPKDLNELDSKKRKDLREAPDISDYETVDGPIARDQAQAELDKKISSQNVDGSTTLDEVQESTYLPRTRRGLWSLSEDTSAHEDATPFNVFDVGHHTATWSRILSLFIHHGADSRIAIETLKQIGYSSTSSPNMSYSNIYILAHNLCVKPETTEVKTKKKAGRFGWHRIHRALKRE